MRDFRLTFLLLLTVLLAAGCTSSFFYNRLDTLVAWYLQDLVTLTSAQRADLRQWLGETLAWHRDSELERYAQYLKSLSEQTTAPMPHGAYERAESQIRSFTAKLVAKTAPDAAVMIMKLSDRQLDELEENLEDKAADRLEEEEELLEDDKWHRRRAKQLSKQLKRFTGTVEPRQKELIEQAAQRLKPSYSEWLASQRAWREALRATVALRDKDPEAARRGLIALLSAPERHWTEEYRRKLTHNRKETIELIAALDATLTAEQRDELRERLLKLARQLESLADTSETAISPSTEEVT